MQAIIRRMMKTTFFYEKYIARILAVAGVSRGLSPLHAWCLPTPFPALKCGFFGMSRGILRPAPF